MTIDDSQALCLAWHQHNDAQNIVQTKVKQYLEQESYAHALKHICIYTHIYIYVYIYTHIHVYIYI